MDGIHDLGGMDGFGKIEVEPNEPTFHERWEARAFALNLASIVLLRAYNADEYRHARIDDRCRSGEFFESLIVTLSLRCKLSEMRHCGQPRW